MLRGQLEQRKLDFSTKIYKNRFTKQTKQTDRNNHQETNNHILDILIVCLIYLFLLFIFSSVFVRLVFKKAVALVCFFLCFSCMYRISYSLRCWPHVSIMRNSLCHFYHPQTQNFMGCISTIPRHGNGVMAWGGIMDDGPMGVLIKIGHGI